MCLGNLSEISHKYIFLVTMIIYLRLMSSNTNVSTYGTWKNLICIVEMNWISYGSHDRRENNNPHEKKTKRDQIKLLKIGTTFLFYLESNLAYHGCAQLLEVYKWF